jgi:hypothetical protein
LLSLKKRNEYKTTKEIIPGLNIERLKEASQIQMRSVNLKQLYDQKQTTKNF